MRYQTYGFTISFFVHAAGIFLLVSFCRFVPVETKTLLIDFSTFSAAKPVAMPAKALLPVRPQSNPSPPPEKKTAKETPPALIAKIKPAKKKIKVIRPQPAAPAAIAVVPPPEPEPELSAEVVELEPAPAPSRQEKIEENMARVADRPIASKTTSTHTAAQSAPMGKKEYIKAHFLYIKEGIQNNITYPRLARKMGWEGKVVVSFVITEDGMVIDVKIVESSGFSLLDNNAIKTIKKTAPFPKPPVRAEMILPITYQLS